MRTGIEWLGKLSLPAHWQAGPINRFGTVSLGKMLQPDNKGHDVFAPYLRAANVQPDGVLKTDDFKSMWFDSDELRDLSLNRGDVVVVEGGIGGYGRAAYVRDNSLSGWGFQNSINRIRPISGNDGRYLAYVLLSVRSLGYFSAYCNVVSMPHLTAEKLAALPVPLPPMSEQRRIADFLDHETVRIDALIAKQEQLIEILRERRQAVLDAKFEALGAERVQLRRGIRFLTSGSRGWGDYYAEEGERFLRIGNLSRTSLTLRGDIQYVQLPPGVTEGSRTRLRRADLLFSITAYLGSVAMVNDEWIGAYVSQHVALCRLDPSIFDSQFIGYFMLTTEGQDQLKLGAAGGTKIQLALDDIKALSVPLVPLGAQRKIVARIEMQLSRIDALIAKAEEFIGLARERRAALITEAVTGRIDVSTGKPREGA